MRLSDADIRAICDAQGIDRDSVVAIDVGDFDVIIVLRVPLDLADEKAGTP